MSENENLKTVSKIIGVGALSLALNHLISRYLLRSSATTSLLQLERQLQVEHARLDQDRKQRHSKTEIKFIEPPSELKKWGSVKVVEGDPEDTLLEELKTMTLITCELVKVNNLVIDLALSNYQLTPCPLICHKPKKRKQEAFLMPDSLVHPCAFVIKNCVFKSGQTIQYERKFLKAGPRATQYFIPSRVRADVVCLGSICPGINTVIRELTLMLTEVYKVEKVTGIKKSFEGYYNDQMIQLTPQLVETIHHFGGCFLGTCKSQFHTDKIIKSLAERRVNQLYMIGAYHTLVSARQLYEQIKKRKLQIAVCVIVKAYNREIPIFDNCFGFQSAIEQTQRFVEAGFVAASSYSNSVTLIKVPGQKTGFLAMDACRSARNVNICLVPEFPFDIYGENGLLHYIAKRVRHKGSCKIVYSEGAASAARDLSVEDANRCEHNRTENPETNAFATFLKQLVEKQLDRLNLKPHKVLMFDSVQTVRAVPANSLDTKLCCQLALASIQGLMCGYTNFVTGHLGQKSVWVPIPEMLSHHYSIMLQSHDEDWQRLLAMTGQPSFINDQDDFMKIQ